MEIKTILAAATAALVAASVSALATSSGGIDPNKPPVSVIVTDRGAVPAPAEKPVVEEDEKKDDKPAAKEDDKKDVVEKKESAAGDENKSAAKEAPPVTEVRCKMNLLARVARKEVSSGFHRVTVRVPKGEVDPNGGTVRDIYIPYTPDLPIGASASTVGKCDTPIGEASNIRTVFRGDGTAQVYLPMVGINDDGFQVIIIDGQKRIHSTAYTGDKEVVFR